jgi:exonuclease III
MKVLTWNIRGLNGRSKQRILQNCIKMEDPDILLLQETKCTGKIAEEIFKRCWHTCDSYHTDSKGVAGGLAILWNPATVILDQGFSTSGTLTAHYRAIGSEKDGLITNAYGPQNNQDKDLFLQNLAYISSIVEAQRWIIGGDFNMILTLEEKRGGKKRLEQDNIKFQELLDQHKLVDIENGNGTFTWTNKRSGHQQIACRLDHFLLSETLLLEGPLIESNILPKAGSDHWSVQLWVDTMATPKLKPFRFEKFWLSHPNFQDGSPLVEHDENPEGHQDVLLPAEAQILQATSAKVEQGSLREHLPRKKMLEQKLEALQTQIIQTGHTPTQQQEE